MIKILIRIVRLFKTVLILKGIDFEQLIAIVHVKLTLDNRRNNASLIKGENQDLEKSDNRFSLTLLVYVLLSSFISLYAVVIESVMVSMTLFHSFVMVLFTMTFITDYSSVLLDTSDNIVLLPRPVDNRTLFMARLVHIGLYIGQILLAIGFVPIFVVWIKFGILGGFIFVLTLIMNVLFAVFSISILYLITIRFANREQMKDIINYLQIVMVVLIFSFYQLIPRLFDIKDIANIAFVPQWCHLLIPPVWMAGTVDAVISSKFDLFHVLLIFLCFFVPILGLIEMNRSYSFFLGQKLSELATDYNSDERTKKSNLSSTLAAYITSSAVESAAFKLVWKQLSRDRKIQLQLYPQFAYFFVMLLIVFYSVLGQENSISLIWENLPQTKWYLFFVYLGSTSLSASLSLIPYSDNFSAAWVYFALPIDKPGDVLIASFKVQVIKFFIPFYILLSLIIFAIWGIHVINDVILGFLNVLIIGLTSSIFNRPILPFSEQTNVERQSGSFIRNILNFFIFVSVGTLHYFTSLIPFLTSLLISFQILVLYLLIKKYRNISWSDIKLTDI